MKIKYRLYCIKQHDLKDCGAACISTICRQYGLKISISKIRELAGTDLEGTSAFGLIKALEHLGFCAEGVQAEGFEDLYTNIELPAIAHVIMDGRISHYVVVHKVGSEEIVVGDPGKGIVKYKPDDFGKIWTGVLILISPTEKFKENKNERNAFLRFLKLTIPNKKLLFYIFLSSILVTSFGIIGSFYFKILTDSLIPNGLSDSLHIFSLGFIGLILVKVVIEAIRTQLLIYLGQRLDISLVLGYYKHVVKLPMKFFSDRKVGEIVSRFSDASKIREAISGISLTLMIDVFMVVIGGIVLLNQSPVLFQVTIIPLLLYSFIAFGFQKRLDRNNRNVMESNEDVTSYLVESLNGMSTVKSFNAEDEVSEETEKRFRKFVGHIFSMGYTNNLQISLKGFVKGVFSIVILWVGAIQVLNGKITFGELLSFNALLLYFLTPVENIINLQPVIQTALVASERLMDVLDMKTEQEDKNGKLNPPTLSGDIEFRNVYFRYGTRNLTLSNLSFKINKNQVVAFVGESGSGKTTIAKLLLSFYGIESGEIIINGHNIKELDVKVLRDKVAYISQETFLFNGTILENLMLGNRELSYENVEEVCRKVKIHDFIESLPLKYNTLIEENGSNFSGGQKQRLSIARAILRNPEILIMDEATSNLDSITEKSIDNVIKELSKNMTIIIIAHRLRTIMKADNICVLENGEIVESGNHHELMEREGIYYSFYNINSNLL